jgi:hypothetical protein
MCAHKAQVRFLEAYGNVLSHLSDAVTGPAERLFGGSVERRLLEEALEVMKEKHLT